jgi:hypothetical protein
MTDNVIELRPGIRQIENDAEPLGPHIPAMNLADPSIEVDVMRECRNYALDVHSRCYEYVSDQDLARAINVASSVSTILQSLARGRMARRALQIARDVDAACKQAIEAAEKL